MSDPQRVEPNKDEAQQPLDRTADLLRKLLRVPKDEMDDIQRGHEG